MRTAIIALIGLATICGGNPGHAEEKVTTRQITGNYPVRLIAARTSDVRGQNLEARFVPLDKPDGPEIFVQFPAHSFTPHEVTLMAIIRSCVGRPKPNNAGDVHSWAKASVPVTFSIPKDAQGYVTNFDKWWLVSLEPMPHPTNTGQSQSPPTADQLR